MRVDELTNELDDMLAAIKRNRDLEIELEKRMREAYGDFGYKYIPRAESPTDRRVAFKDGLLRVYSEFHGSGLRRSVLLISALINSKNTALLIEEIEPFQHPEALKVLAKNIVELARKNNVQLFITSHSYFDALRSFYYVFENESQREKEFRCFLVKRQNGKVEVRVSDVLPIIQELY